MPLLFPLKLWAGYGTDSDSTHLLSSYDWYFTPVTNPDGYEYTFVCIFLLIYLITSL